MAGRKFSSMLAKVLQMADIFQSVHSFKYSAWVMVICAIMVSLLPLVFAWCCFSNPAASQSLRKQLCNSNRSVLPIECDSQIPEKHPLIYPHRVCSTRAAWTGGCQDLQFIPQTITGQPRLHTALLLTFPSISVLTPQRLSVCLEVWLKGAQLLLRSHSPILLNHQL